MMRIVLGIDNLKLSYTKTPRNTKLRGAKLFSLNQYYKLVTSTFTPTPIVELMDIFFK